MADETTTQALARLGYTRADHEPGGELCRRLGGSPLGCIGRHVERISDGDPVIELGCSAPVSAANEWIGRMDRS